MKIERCADSFSTLPTHLVIALHNSSEHLRFFPIYAVGTRHRKKTACGIDAQSFSAAVTRMEEKESLSRNIPRLCVGKIRHEHALKFVDGIRLGAVMNIRGMTRPV